MIGLVFLITISSVCEVAKGHKMAQGAPVTVRGLLFFGSHGPILESHDGRCLIFPVLPGMPKELSRARETNNKKIPGLDRILAVHRKTPKRERVSFPVLIVGYVLHRPEFAPQKKNGYGFRGDFEFAIQVEDLREDDSRK